MACTASISKFESPSDMRFVMIWESSCCRTSRKACNFHLLTSPGKARSNLPRAEMMLFFTFMSTDMMPGIYLAALHSTHPSMAFVMMKQWSARRSASSNKSLEAVSIPRKWRSTLGGGGWSCLMFKYDVHSNVSSQSKIMTVWCLGGRLTVGTHTCAADTLRRYDTRKSSTLFRLRSSISISLSSLPISSEFGVVCSNRSGASFTCCGRGRMGLPSIGMPRRYR
mmetsp:Transcript_57377/g.134547  ORF Transcript_57377/g.134547 Transcript_57377/m.134547 type:complete len:224 (-) Transcript_57377:215-886(-)